MLIKNMKNLIKIIGFASLLLTLHSCPSYRLMTVEPCLPKNDEDRAIISRIINYFQHQHSDSSLTKLNENNNPIYTTKR